MNTDSVDNPESVYLGLTFELVELRKQHRLLQAKLEELKEHLAAQREGLPLREPEE